MAKKSKASKKPNMALPAAPVQHCNQPRPPCSAREEEDQLAKAILASKMCAMQVDTYKDSLEVALELSKVFAEAEKDEEEALSQAIAASLADAGAKEVGLGLASSFPVVSSNFYSTPADKALPDSQQEMQGAVASIADVPAEVSKVIKVTCGKDMRRLHIIWPSAAPPAVIVCAIQNAVETCFGICISSHSPRDYLLKYTDEEGDLCTLVKETVEDFLQLSLGPTMKLTLEKSTLDSEFEMVGAAEAVSSDVNEDIDCEESAAAEDVEGIKDEPASEKQDFFISSPPATPRAGCSCSTESSIEEDYDASWNLVEAAPKSNGLTNVPFSPYA